MNIIDEELAERLELATERIIEIKDEDWTGDATFEAMKEYFNFVAEFIIYTTDMLLTKDVPGNFDSLSIDKLDEINRKMYEDILPENYEKSYANPDFACEKLGEYGAVMSALYAEIRTNISYAYEQRYEEYVANMELFLLVYSMWSEAFAEREEGLKAVSIKSIREAIYYYMYDYADVLVSRRTKITIDPDADTFAYDIVMNSDLNDLRYLYKYGEYITENEIKTAQFLNNLPEEKVKAMANTFVRGFVDGFKTMRIDMSPKRAVNIRYAIGQERMIKYAVEMFGQYNLKPIMIRYAVSRINRKLTIRNGYVGTPANKQYEYDHRMDEEIFFDKAFAERKLEVIRQTYEENKQSAFEYAGPAVIETFGENPFTPAAKDSALKLSEKQQKLQTNFSAKSAEITNEYIPRDKYSFTIIAYPLPEIGDNYEEIYEEIVKVNTLDNELYKGIQQKIIDVLDQAEYVRVLGANGNKTDMKVMLHKIDIEKETNFENCLADVNIPLGEVFTSPVLTGTEGTLNVSQVYLNDLKYENLTIKFENGCMKEYTCDNFDDEEKNKNFIHENIMFSHDTLPIGEFAIGTNTIAYVMAHKYDILYKLPILIVEKMGPHFAVGDTCYSYSEDAKLYNPDGREIIAKENECSMLRNSADKAEAAKAYFNCHTDITIPYEEIGEIYAVTADGRKLTVIKDGRFVVEGTEKLNEAFA